MKEKKKRTAGDWIRLVVLLFAIGVFCFSAYKLANIWLVYKQGENEYENLQQYVTVVEEDTKEKEEEKPEESLPEEEEDPEAAFYPQRPAVDFASLTEINSEVIGWLDMRAIDISYPIAKGSDNDYYLHHTVEGTDNIAGSIFMDYENKKDFSDCNSIIYGHNMKNQSMFGKLKQYLSQETYDSDPYFWICTPTESYLYKIFAVYETPIDSSTYTFFSGRGEEFTSWAQSMAQNTVITTGVEVTGEDNIVTLSTCTSDSSVRCVVQAKRIKIVK